MKIGDSRGVRIPKSMLEQAGLTDEIDIAVIDRDIKISAVEPANGLQFAALSEQALGDWAHPEEYVAWANL